MDDNHYRSAPRRNIADAVWETHPEFGGAEWIFHRSTDGRRVVAAWREDGRHTFTYPFDEFAYVISGRAKVAIRGGESFELRAGDLVYFTEGMTVDFEMSEGFMDVTMLVSDRAVEWR